MQLVDLVDLSDFRRKKCCDWLHDWPLTATQFRANGPAPLLFSESSLPHAPPVVLMPAWRLIHNDLTPTPYTTLPTTTGSDTPGSYPAHLEDPA